MIFSEVFKSLKSICILLIFVADMEEFPGEIGYLIHRVQSANSGAGFTDFASSIYRLPRLICKLYHLQIIELDY